MSVGDAIGILGTESGSQIRELKAALENLGCKVLLIDPRKMTSSLPDKSILYTADNNPGMIGSGRQNAAPTEAGFAVKAEQTRLEGLKGLIVRSLPGGSLEQVIYRVNVLHYLEKLGVKVINSASVIEKTVDKFFTSALLAESGLPVPRTVVTENYVQAMEAVEEIGSVVVKPIFGSLGKGIVRIDEPDTAHRVFKALELGRYVFYVQEYLESGGEDFRIMVAGGKVIGAMRRQGEHWKTNISYGATAEKYQPEPEMIRLALRTAEVLKADYAGVDIIVSGDKPYILEANSVPGWKGLQTVSDIDIAHTLAEFFLQRISE